MSHYTYMVTNNINGKVYVGSHSWSGEGIDPNYYGSGTAITRAVKKYGKENFQVEVLYYYETAEECRADEERILTEYNVRDCPYSYNCKNSAVGFTSEDMTDEIRQKISQANKGKTISEEHRKKLSQAHKGKTKSEEHRKKLSQTLKGRIISDATRQKISQTLKRKTASEEYRQKLSQAMTGKNNPMYGKRGKDSPNYGKHRTCETRKKLSQVQNDKKIPVAVIDKNGKVKIFESIIKCARKLKLNSGHISNCLKGKRKSTGGYIIKYLKRCSTDYKITKRKAKKTEKIKLTTKRKGITPVVAIQKDTGRVRMFKSQSECSRVLRIDCGSISKCLKGRYKTCGGYTFKKINRDRRVFKVSQRSKADINR